MNLKTKLSLNRETLRQLTDKESFEAAGAGGYSYLSICPACDPSRSCPSKICNY